MDAKKREIRNLECQLSYREASAEENSEGNLGTIVGTAIVFNSESEILDDEGQYFREVIKPEAVTMPFLDTQDVKINLLHVRELTFGRVNRGDTRNARFWVDREAMHFEVNVPNCDLGIRARELTRTGVYTGCSFEFIPMYDGPDKFKVEQREGDLPLITHTKFRMISAITLGMDPAYQATALSARELHTHTSLYDEEMRQAEQQKQREEQAKAEALHAEMLRRLEIMRTFN